MNLKEDSKIKIFNNSGKETIFQKLQDLDDSWKNQKHQFYQNSKEDYSDKREYYVNFKILNKDQISNSQNKFVNQESQSHENFILEDRDVEVAALLIDFVKKLMYLGFNNSLFFQNLKNQRVQNNNQEYQKDLNQQITYEFQIENHDKKQVQKRIMPQICLNKKLKEQSYLEQINKFCQNYSNKNFEEFLKDDLQFQQRSDSSSYESPPSPLSPSCIQSDQILINSSRISLKESSIINQNEVNIPQIEVNQEEIFHEVNFIQFQDDDIHCEFFEQGKNSEREINTCQQNAEILPGQQDQKFKISQNMNNYKDLKLQKENYIQEIQYLNRLGKSLIALKQMKFEDLVFFIFESLSSQQNQEINLQAKQIVQNFQQIIVFKKNQIKPSFDQNVQQNMIQFQPLINHQFYDLQMEAQLQNHRNQFNQFQQQNINPTKSHNPKAINNQNNNQQMYEIIDDRNRIPIRINQDISSFFKHSQDYNSFTTSQEYQKDINSNQKNQFFENQDQKQILQQINEKIDNLQNEENMNEISERLGELLAHHQQLFLKVVYNSPMHLNFQIEQQKKLQQASLIAKANLLQKNLAITQQAHFNPQYLQMEYNLLSDQKTVSDKNQDLIQKLINQHIQIQINEMIQSFKNNYFHLQNNEKIENLISYVNQNISNAFVCTMSENLSPDEVQSISYIQNEFEKISQQQKILLQNSYNFKSQTLNHQINQNQSMILMPLNFSPQNQFYQYSNQQQVYQNYQYFSTPSQDMDLQSFYQQNQMVHQPFQVFDQSYDSNQNIESEIQMPNQLNKNFSQSSFAQSQASEVNSSFQFIDSLHKLLENQAKLSNNDQENNLQKPIQNKSGKSEQNSQAKIKAKKNNIEIFQKDSSEQEQDSQALYVAQNLSLDIVKEMAYECSLDPKCSRFIQKRLDLSNDNDELLRFFDKLIIKNSQIEFQNLVKDQNGNYIIQKILQKSNQNQVYHSIIFDNLMDNLYEYSVNKHGCRVVQTCFDVMTLNQQEQLIEELLRKNKLNQCSFDFNGNHVIQKIVTVIKDFEYSDLYPVFIKEIEKQVIEYCLHEYCCRIIQRMIENCQSLSIENLISIIFKNYDFLIKNQFGTFVLCSILENGENRHKNFLMEKVRLNILQMSTDKDGSKLLENCVKMAGLKNQKIIQEKLDKILDLFIKIEIQDLHFNRNFDITFDKILTNQYGNYVVQTAFESSNKFQRKIIIDKVQATLKMLNNNIQKSPIRHVILFLKKYKIFFNLAQPKSLNCSQQDQNQHKQKNQNLKQQVLNQQAYNDNQDSSISESSQNICNEKQINQKTFQSRKNTQQTYAQSKYSHNLN